MVIGVEAGHHYEEGECLCLRARNEVQLDELRALAEVGQHIPRYGLPWQHRVAEGEPTEAPVDFVFPAGRIVAVKRLGRFGSRKEIWVEARRHQEIADRFVVLNLDPYRLNPLFRERHAVNRRAFFSRKH
jgi:hypothetical protein